MKVLYYTSFGDPGQLYVKELEKPMPGKGEVLVKVMATSLNSWDVDLLFGSPKLYRPLFGLFKPRFNILGCDIAGVVHSIGDGVSHLKPGDEVVGDISDQWGGLAEYVVAKESSLFSKPPNLSFEEAAAIPQAAVLALQALRDKRKIKKGEKILINGAGGGVGTFALQLARNLGAEVTCVDALEKLDMLKQLGAQRVIDYKTTNFTQTGDKYHLIVDVIGKQNPADYKKALLPNGYYAIIGGKPSTILNVLLSGALAFGKHAPKMGVVVHQPNKYLPEILEMAATGRIETIIDTVYSLSEAPTAFKRLANGEVIGKVVIGLV